MTSLSVPVLDSLPLADDVVAPAAKVGDAACEPHYSEISESLKLIDAPKLCYIVQNALILGRFMLYHTISSISIFSGLLPSIRSYRIGRLLPCDWPRTAFHSRLGTPDTPRSGRGNWDAASRSPYRVLSSARTPEAAVASLGLLKAVNKLKSGVIVERQDHKLRDLVPCFEGVCRVAVVVQLYHDAARIACIDHALAHDAVPDIETTLALQEATIHLLNTDEDSLQLYNL